VHEDNTLEITGVDEIPRVKDYNIEVNENGNKSEDTGEIEMPKIMRQTLHKHYKTSVK